MIRGKSVLIDFDQSTPEIHPDSFEFILAPPPLWQTIRIAVAPNFWVGESFISGAWYLKKGNLSDFLRRIRADATKTYGKYFAITSKLKGIRHYIQQYLLNKYVTRKVRNHYDIDTAIYKLILDDELIYTCGFFDAGHKTLADAQQNKIAAAISRMDLPWNCPRVLDIGCGWGATERALAKSHPTATICGLSISSNQLNWAKHRDIQVLSKEQAERIEYRLEDYEDHDRSNYYDAVCSIGMIEHVGLGGYHRYFSKIEKFLKPGGTALIHTIVSPISAKPTNRWIDKHIFRGGYAPSIAELTRSIERNQLRISDIYIYGPEHYRMTIESWIENLTQNWSQLQTYLRRSSCSEIEIDRISRMWLFYLSGVRNMFAPDEPRTHQVAQLCIKKL